MVWIPFFKAGASFGRTGWGVIKVLGTPARVPLWAKMRRRPCAPRLSSHGCVVYTSYLIWVWLTFMRVWFFKIYVRMYAIIYYIYTCTFIWLNIICIQLAHINIHIYIYNYMQVDGSQTCIVSINVPYAWIYSCTCNYICTRKFNIQHDNIFTQYHYNPQGHIHTPKKRIWCITCLWSARGNNFMTCDQLYKSCRCVCP